MSKRRSKTFHEGLGPSQMDAFTQIVDGNSIFLTGSAGTGKSELLRRLVGYWDSIQHRYGLTASTGIAALNIGGRTFHSFLRLSPDDDDPGVTSANVYERISKQSGFKFFTNTIRGLSTLVIDEISMLDPEFLKKASDVVKMVRMCSEPFGGLQLVFVGDFFQLPHISKSSFLFETAFFYEAIKSRVILTETFRQKDTRFIELLGRMRTGTLNTDDLDILKSRVDANVESYGVLPTELWSTNRDVDRLNLDRLSQIKTESVFFDRHAGIRGDVHTKEIGTMLTNKFLKDLNIPEKIELKAPPYANFGDTAEGREDAIKLGAQVMLTFNLDTEAGLVNGSRGVIIDFVEPPSTLGASTSASIFHNFHEDSLDDSKAYIRGLKMPKVRFVVNGRPKSVLVPYVRWTRKSSAEGLKSKVLVYAWSIPLKLAWATTVHKSQGQSLDFVKASLDKTVFAEGQAYVAVSRARTLEGLTLASFDPSVVRASAKVMVFYEKPFGPTL